MPDIATAALIRKRAELAGEIEATSSQLAQMRANLVHLDAVLRLLDPDAVPAEIAPKRQVTRCAWFGQGELPRLVLDALRQAPEPITTRDVAKGVMEQRGMPEGDRVTFLLVEKRVDRYLRRQEGRLVERVALGARSVGWRIAGQ